MTTSETTRSDRAPEPVGAYPHAKRVGDLLFLSGVGPRQRGRNDIPGATLDANGAIVDYEIDVQCRACFDNVRTILEDSGSNWDNIVDVLVFLTNIKDDFKAYNAVFAEYFAGEGKPNPTRTTIEVSALPVPQTIENPTPIAVEVKVIATIE